MKDDLTIKEGITEEQIEELLYQSKSDPHIHENTNDLVRFASRAHWDQWVKKGRRFFVLTNSQDNLLGVIWITKKKMPDEVDERYRSLFDMTFAIRLYKSARGKKLSYTFMEEVFKRADLSKVWLTVLKTNYIAKALYEKFGFKTIFSNDKICVMIYERS